jgi:hypothetical protein
VLAREPSIVGILLERDGHCGRGELDTDSICKVDKIGRDVGLTETAGAAENLEHAAKRLVLEPEHEVSRLDESQSGGS